MKKHLLKGFSAFAVVLVALAVALKNVHANGFEGPGLGARATSMGGAFIGVADDWTAIYWNPAGLAQLRGGGVGVGAEYLHIRSHDSAGLANPPVPLLEASIRRGDVFAQLGGEPAAFRGSDSSFGVVLPSAGGYWRFGRVTVAGGSYAPLGYHFEVRDRHQPGYDASFMGQGYLLNHNLSLATSVNPHVRVGAGVNLVQARVERLANKTSPTQESFSTSEGKDVQVQGVFGLHADWRQRLFMGAVYRMGQDLGLEGDAVVSGLGPIPGERSPFRQTLRNPTTYGMGIAYKVVPELLLAADWQRTQWSPMRVNVKFDQPGLILQDQDLDARWSNRSRWRFGLEWQARSWMALRAGTFGDPQAAPYDAQALTQLVDVSARYYTAGFSLGWRLWKCHWGAQYQAGRARLPGREIKKEALALTVGVDYTFKG